MTISEKLEYLYGQRERYHDKLHELSMDLSDYDEDDPEYLDIQIDLSEWEAELDEIEEEIAYLESQQGEDL